MIEAIQENMGTADHMSLKPVLLPGDGASIRACRIIESLIEGTRRKPTAEQAPLAISEGSDY